MGTIRLKYELCESIQYTILANEIEYGTAFALYHDREETIPLWGNELRWISLKKMDNFLVIDVDDDFLGKDYIFEKLLVAFLYNLLDFGELRLISIDISNSSYFRQIKSQQIAPIYFQKTSQKKPLLGTIFKPYYHYSLRDKIKMAEKFTAIGINLLKEDETFFVSKEELLREAQIIQSIIKGNGNYIPNITHYVHDYYFLERLLDSGIEIVMVDFLITGFRPILRLKQKFPEICVWGHRVGYWTIERFISMDALGVLALLSGIDFLHIGTPNNKKEEGEKLQLISFLRSINPWFVPVFTKTTPEILMEISYLFDGTVALMACGYFRDDRGAINWGKVQEWVFAAQSVEGGNV